MMTIQVSMTVSTPYTPAQLELQRVVVARLRKDVATQAITHLCEHCQLVELFFGGELFFSGSFAKLRLPP